MGYRSWRGGKGFDTKILRKVIQIRKQDKDERMEQEAILDTYLQALGMIEIDAQQLAGVVTHVNTLTGIDMLTRSV